MAGERAWEQAGSAAARAGVRLRPARDLGDAERIATIVVELWGTGQMPPSLLRAFEHAGTVILVAEPPAAPAVGFVLGFPGLRDGLHVHSHMLGVVPAWQARGVGAALKLGQRAACLDAGIGEARWTYDPLVRRNAWFNLVKLGTVATGFLAGFYGEMDDEINIGDRSDRFEVRWLLGSERADRAASGRATEPAGGPALLEIDDRGRPVESGRDPEPGALVRIPEDHHAQRAGDPSLGNAWRDASRRVFESCFEAGLQATWMRPDGCYVFEERPS